MLVAACALVDVDGRVLLAQRPAGKPMAGLWEFPGGKVEAGERPEQTLIRELKEELAIVVDEACLAPLTFASHVYPDFHLLMSLFICRRWQGMVAPREGQRVTWVTADRLEHYPMPPADKPLIPVLRDLLSSTSDTGSVHSRSERLFRPSEKKRNAHEDDSARRRLTGRPSRRREFLWRPTRPPTAAARSPARAASADSRAASSPRAK